MIQIALPSLHERLKDIPILFQHFALTACSKYHLSAPPMIDHKKRMGRANQNLGHKKTLAEKVNAFEKNLIAQELARTNGSVKETYLTLGVPRKTFYDKMHKHGLKRKDFQPTAGLPGKHLAFFR